MKFTPYEAFKLDNTAPSAADPEFRAYELPNGKVEVFTTNHLPWSHHVFENKEAVNQFFSTVKNTKSGKVIELDLANFEYKKEVNHSISFEDVKQEPLNTNRTTAKKPAREKPAVKKEETLKNTDSELPFYGEKEQKENISKLVGDSAYEAANAFTGGGLDEMVQRKSTGGFWSDLGGNLWIGGGTFANMLTFGFKDSIKEGIAQTQRDMSDFKFEHGDYSDGSGAELALSFGYGTYRGIGNNIVDLLPAEELYTFMDDKSSTADLWRAGAMSVTKIASLGAMGRASMKGPGRPKTGPNQVQILGHPVGHSALLFETTKHFVDKMPAAASGFLRKISPKWPVNRPGKIRASAKMKPKSVEAYNKESTLNIETAAYKKGLAYAIRESQGKNIKYNYLINNCSQFIGRVLGKMGVEDLFSLTPGTLNFSLKYPMFMQAIKGSLIFSPFRANSDNPSSEKNNSKP